MEDEMEAYEYNSYWEFKRFIDNEELNQRYLIDSRFKRVHLFQPPSISSSSLHSSFGFFPQADEIIKLIGYSWGIDEPCLGFSNLTSPDSAQSSGAAVDKSVTNERNRRKKLNDSICRIRSIVPRISKMDKASTIKDAIEYVEELQEQERQLEAEIAEIQSKRAPESSSPNDCTNCISSYPSLAPGTCNLPPIELSEFNVQEIGEGNYIISITCNKKNGAMSSICEVIDYIDLKIITSNITTVSGCIMFTLTVQAEELTSSQLREKIENSISMINRLRRH